MPKNGIAPIVTKGGIDGDHIWDSAAKASKKWVRAKLKESPARFSQFTGLIAKLGHGISMSLLGRVIDLEKRIAALEGYVPADADLFDELGKCLKRVDNMESELSERSICYRGYWRNGFNAKRGDLVTEDGSLFIAVRATDEKPTNHATDWALAARKGKDAPR